MKKYLLIGFVAILVVVLGSFVWHKSKEGNFTPSASAGNNSAISSVKGSPGVFSASEVATHKNASSCWAIIDGSVYDLTNWIPRHPGGEQAILGICGKDGSAPFHGQHGDSQEQQRILATMKIGTVKK